MRRRSALAWLLVLVAAAPAAAQESKEPLRPCRRADLIGIWRVVRFGFASGADVDRSDPAYLPHQRYVFNADATTTYAASATMPTADEDRALTLAVSAVTWTIDARGRLVRQRQGAARADISECRVVLRKLSDRRSPMFSQPGDLVLTDLGEDSQPLTRRLLRKLGSED